MVKFVETGQPPGFLLKWGSNGSGDGQLYLPWDVASFSLIAIRRLV